jgi:4-amino-4-deoxy-L-arabinose transferase-like glycosyltransferase
MPKENDKPAEEATKPVNWEVPLSMSREERFASGCLFWLLAWLGTIFAGGIFGTFMGISIGMSLGRREGIFEIAIFGLFMGLVIAGAVAILVHLHAAFFTWAFWLGRFRVAMAILAGALTGFIATGRGATLEDPKQLALGVILPTLLGAMGSGLAAFFYHRRIASRDNKLMRVSSVGEFAIIDEGVVIGGNNKTRRRKRARWQFSIRDLFIHFTAIAVLISLWTTFSTLIRSEQKQDIQPPVVESLESDDEQPAGD